MCEHWINLLDLPRMQGEYRSSRFAGAWLIQKLARWGAFPRSGGLQHRAKNDKNSGGFHKGNVISCYIANNSKQKGIRESDILWHIRKLNPYRNVKEGASSHPLNTAILSKNNCQQHEHAHSRTFTVVGSTCHNDLSSGWQVDSEKRTCSARPPLTPVSSTLPVLSSLIYSLKNGISHFLIVHSTLWLVPHHLFNRQTIRQNLSYISEFDIFFNHLEIDRISDVFCVVVWAL